MRQLKKQNIILKDGKPAVLSTVEIVPGEFETMLASPDFGHEYDVLRARTEAQAMKHFRFLRDEFHCPPLTGNSNHSCRFAKCFNNNFYYAI